MELKKMLLCQVSFAGIMKSSFFSPINTQVYLDNENSFGFQRKCFKGKYYLWSHSWNLLIDSWIMFDVFSVAYKNWQLWELLWEHKYAHEIFLPKINLLFWSRKLTICLCTCLTADTDNLKNSSMSPLLTSYVVTTHIWSIL